MPAPPNLKTRKIKFTVDTAVNIHHVGREHMGRVKYRPASKNNPQAGSRMEPYFAAGTEIEVPDYEASGAAVTVTGPEIPQPTETGFVEGPAPEAEQTEE